MRPRRSADGPLVPTSVRVGLSRSAGGRGSDGSPTGDAWRESRLLVLAGLVLPVALAGALVPLRSDVNNTNMAFALLIVVVAVAAGGRRSAAAVAALSAALSFDFFFTIPYQSFAIRSRNDLQTELSLLFVGLIVGEIAARARRHRATAIRRGDYVTRIYSLAEMIASGEPADFVIIAVASELRELLDLKDCRFERTTGEGTGHPPRLERSGDVTWGRVTWGVHSMGLPSREVELRVEGQGHVYGRYLLVPTPGRPVSFERRLVAVALADQVGAALAAQSGTRSSD